MKTLKKKVSNNDFFSAINNLYIFFNKLEKKNLNFKSKNLALMKELKTITRIFRN